jgi:hypothetical protein
VSARCVHLIACELQLLIRNVILKPIVKAVPLHAMEALGVQEV